jgi:hypothetical protein
MLANGLNRPLDVGLIAERDGHPPVICHNADSTAPPPGGPVRDPPVRSQFRRLVR